MRRSSTSFDLAHRELHWFKKELLRPTGVLMWVVVYWVALNGVRYAALRSQQNFLLRWHVLDYAFGTLSAVALLYPLVRAIYLRSLVPVCGDRLRDLTLTRLKWKSLWPALFLAPVCVLATLLLGTALYSCWSIMLMDPALRALPAPGSGHPVLSHLYANYQVYRAIAEPIGLFGVGYAMIAFATCFTLPRKNGPLLLGLMIVGFILNVFLWVFLSPLIHDLYYSAHPGLKGDAEFRRFLGGVVGQLERGVVGILFGLAFLIALRSDSKQRAVLRHAGVEVPAKGETERPRTDLLRTEGDVEIGKIGRR